MLMVVLSFVFGGCAATQVEETQEEDAVLVNIADWPIVEGTSFSFVIAYSPYTPKITVTHLNDEFAIVDVGYYAVLRKGEKTLLPPFWNSIFLSLEERHGNPIIARWENPD
jgi:hypothetical protein